VCFDRQGRHAGRQDFWIEFTPPKASQLG